MENELWNQWADCHSSSDQQKRIASAKKSACTPTFIDQVNCSGTFKGSSGNHTTSLEKCSCIDFNRRRLPCKHMYRLAMELELFNENFDSNKDDIVEKKAKISETVELVETFSNEQQLLLLDVIRNISSTHPCYCVKSSDDLTFLIDHGLLKKTFNPELILPKFKKNELVELANKLNLNDTKGLLKQDLISYIIDNASDQLAKMDIGYSVVCCAPTVKSRKLYMYLHRKFDESSYWGFDDPDDFEPIPLLQTVLPDDDVTDLLIQFGYYKK